MATDHRERLRSIRRFDSLVKYLREELDWPIESDDFEELTFDYTPEELGIDSKNAAKIEEIKRLRPLSVNQPWGIFFVKFEPKRLPVVALRRILNSVVLKKRASANSAERTAWETEDLLFVSNYGEDEERQINFAHFSEGTSGSKLPVLKVLGWDNKDTPLHLDHVADQLREKLSWPTNGTDRDTWRETWRSAFTLRHREAITTSRTLALRLAELAREIRDRIRSVLEVETETGAVSLLMQAFKESLVHDLDEDAFADMYAQTVAYGLLSARIANPSAKGGRASQIPVTNPFLKELMETFLHVGAEGEGANIDFDELGIGDVVDLLDDAKMEAVVRDFGDRNPQEDPVIHFYELFLSEYDSKQRMKRGVFYTPRPVVSFIVRSVDELLRSEFGLEYGLADTTTWGEIVERIDGLEIPSGVDPTEAFVQILDPAAGTGTFLVEVIDVIYKTMEKKWLEEKHLPLELSNLWNDYVPEHLLPRLHGYELLMAPYAIAHVKIGLKLVETGYRFGNNERARIYLTNSLEPAQDFSGQFEFAIPALAHEAVAVNDVKQTHRFTVVIGNPPYSGHSSNTGTWITDLVRDYYYVDGVSINERNSKWLQDDYVKFWRLAQLEMSQSGVGLTGMISNHGFLDNPTFRGMRQSLLESFGVLYLCDLHGSTKKRGRSPNGIRDENVFDIQQGVTVTVGIRGPEGVRTTRVRHADMWGTRSVKYEMLSSTTISTHEHNEVFPQSGFYLLIPDDLELREEYETWWSLADIFLVKGVGMTTARDHLVIDFDAERLLASANLFKTSTASNADLCQKLGIPQKKGWDIAKARKSLAAETDLARFIKPIMYRPFDDRLIFYHDSLVWRTVRAVMSHMQQLDNVGLITTRSFEIGGIWEHIFCTRAMIQHHSVSLKEVNYLFPLYTVDDETKLTVAARRAHNFSRGYLRALRQAVGVAESEPETVFGYIYGVLHSQGYRQRYSELLRLDFPRVPMPYSRDLIARICHLGSQLIGLHLLKGVKTQELPIRLSASPTYEVRRVGWLDNTVWLDAKKTNARAGHRATKPGTVGFHGVPEEVWDFHIGGYQVCHKWLKDRKGRTLSEEDIEHYQKIVVAISETIRVMGEIDEVIEEHGGWPGAFVTDE